MVFTDRCTASVLLTILLFALALAIVYVARTITRPVMKSRLFGFSTIKLSPSPRPEEIVMPSKPSPARGAQTLLTGLAFGESPRWRTDRLWFADWGSDKL
jgi:hypothetical protein